jgi:hypothetical protein
MLYNNLMNDFDGGYDVDLDTVDQYAAEDAQYLYSGPLPDDSEEE